MESKIFLERYRLSLGRNGWPVELDRSSNARTFRAHEITTGSEVALTLVSPAPNDSASLERLQSLARAAKRINQTSIPQLYDFGRQDDDLIYVSEYCEGHTAAAWVAVRGPFPIGAVLRAALQVVEAMHVTAFDGLHHPALNPDNLLFVCGQPARSEWPSVRVLHWFTPGPDFAARGDPKIDAAAQFAAPEQLWNGEVDLRAEIYSLGATMRYLLTGTPPAAPIPGKLRGVPKIVRHLLDRMLSVNPAERPQDPVALGSYLQTCLARVERREKIERRLGVPLLARLGTAGSKVRLPIPVKPLAWAAGFVGVAALAILFLPWTLAYERLARSGEQKPLGSASAPNETPAKQNDSNQRKDVTWSSASPVAAPTAPVAADRKPQESYASTARAHRRPVDPPAPAEGPVEKPAAARPFFAANAPQRPPPDQAPMIKQPNEPSIESAPSTARSATTPAAEDKSEAVADNARAPEPEHALTKRTTKRKKLAQRARASRTDQRVAHRVKRAQPLPELRVGSSPAELVGTTEDGQWILSVADTGERVIVPPPPGFGE